MSTGAGAAIKSALEQKGYTVTWVDYIGNVPMHERDGPHVQVRASIADVPYAQSFVALRLVDFDGAFVGSMAIHSKPTLTCMVHELREAGVKSCGISHDASYNNILEMSGAITSCLRSEVCSELDNILSKLL